MAGTYDFFDHDADVGIIGKGATIEEAFTEAAQAMFSTMSDFRHAGPDQTVEISFVESDPEIALVTYLNSLLAEARKQGLNLHHFQLFRSDDHWEGISRGKAWSEKEDRGTEVKGATLTMLSVRETSDGWEARCVVDV